MLHTPRCCYQKDKRTKPGKAAALEISSLIVFHYRPTFGFGGTFRISVSSHHINRKRFVHESRDISHLTAVTPVEL
jgi:hypothetical protein